METPVPKPRIRVASVYGPSPWNTEWLALQDAFMRRCSDGVDFEFDVYLNGTDIDTRDTMARVIGRSTVNVGHALALQRILDHYRTTERGADGYLLLDSDCFPIHPGWWQVLTGLMAQHGKRYAAPVRFENLEPYPHPCALYVDAIALDDPLLRFEGESIADNLLGHPVRDVGAGLLPLQGGLLPLVRTNVHNPHPIAAAVYNHLFYHHGAGSRRFGFRAINRYGYYDHWRPEASQAEADSLTHLLFADPERFIRSLVKP